MYNPIVRILLSIFLAVLFVSCNKSEAKFDPGKVSNSYYTNKTLGMRVQLPSTWNPLSREQIAELMGVGQSMVTGGDRALDTAMDASEERTHHLFMVMQEPLGTPVDMNPNIVSSAENISLFPGVKNGGDYLEITIRTLSQSQIQSTVLSVPTPIAINGNEFYKAQIEMSIGALKVKQDYFATVLKGYAVVFVNSYNTDSQKSILDNVVQSIVIEE